MRENLAVQKYLGLQWISRYDMCQNCFLQRPSYLLVLEYFVVFLLVFFSAKEPDLAARKCLLLLYTALK